MAKSISHAMSSADPKNYVLGAASAARLASLTGLPAEKLAGRTLAEVSDEFHYEIEPELFLFRKVCGTVVKTNPVTGNDDPVPFATVQVEDTDCSFVGYFPSNSPWSWMYPFNCRREVIATTRTDACGNFCVWIPRFDIDRVLNFMRERHCFPVVFDRPSLGDILKAIDPREVPPGAWKGPWPGPDPVYKVDRAQLARSIHDSFGPEVSAKISRLQDNVKFGALRANSTAMLDQPADLSFMQPSLPAELKAMRGSPKKRGGSKEDLTMASATIAAQIGVQAEALRGLDIRKYYGPFWRCYDLYVPVWTTIVDVPDITFRVLQDTNGDGVEEQIYGESHFAVRWGGAISQPLVIHAGPNAIASAHCGMPPVPCGDVPAIILAGRLPVTGDPAVFDGTLGDATAGYARRTNRPHPSGAFTEALPIPEGMSPLTGVLSLFGCNRTDKRASHYRLMYRYSGNEGASFTSPTPFLNMSHTLYRLVGGIGNYMTCTPDPQGWFPILPDDPNPWLPQDLLLDWPSTALASGLYGVTLELGTGGTVTSSSQEVAFVVDNTAPTGPIQIEVGASASGPFQPINSVCPGVRRGAVPQDRYFRVTLSAAAKHLRSAEMWAYGCGSGDFSVVSGTVIGGIQSGSSTVIQHWHQTPADNDQVMQAVYLLPASAAEGTYTVGGIVSGRAFSPNDGNGYTASPQWQYDPNSVYITPSTAFSVFNADP